MTELRGEWKQNFPMSRLSTWRVGGPARELFLPADLDDLREFYQNDSRASNAFVVGHGSNLLVRDGGIDGLVVRVAPGLSALRLQDDGLVYAEAGVGCPKLAKFCAARGFVDAAFLAGVPGTVGGAAAMNAGCEGSEIWNHVEQAMVLTKSGQIKTLPRSEFVAEYRSLTLITDREELDAASETNSKSGKSECQSKSESDDASRQQAPFFVALQLRFESGDADAAQTRVRELLRRRDQSQPVGSANCGSVFRNPDGGHAGKLIDECGLKGLRVGGAKVSEKHANFIINDRQASASDIEQLIFLVQHKVKEKTGVVLSPEVRITGQEEA